MDLKYYIYYLKLLQIRNIMVAEFLKYILIIILIVVTGVEPILAQTSAYHSIVFPYAVSSRQALTLGGIINAVPDRFSGAQMNPGGLAFFKKPALVVNYSINMTHYGINHQLNDESNHEITFQHDPGIVSALLSIVVFDKYLVLAITGQQLNSPEFELWEEFNSDQDMDLQHGRSGNVWNTNFAVSTEPFRNFGIGLNVSKWFGSWSWKENVDGSPLGQGIFNYSGASFALGFLYQGPKLQLGLNLYSPFSLMNSSEIENESWYVGQIRSLDQRFKGAVRLGLSYLFTPETRLGIGYFWQNKFYINNRFKQDPSRSFTDPYGNSHQISLAVSRNLNGQSWKLPFFLAYRAIFMPHTDGSFPGDYQIIRINNKENIQHSVLAGLQLLYRSYVFDISAQWTKGSIHVLNLYAPPWS